MNFTENIENSDFLLIACGEEFEKRKDAIDAYNILADKIKDKNYFIVNLCIDDSIYDSSLNKEKIVKPLGTHLKKQCVDACNHDLYDITESVCPVCGKELVFNSIETENYVEEGYLPMWEAYKKWLTFSLNKKLFVVELGVNLAFPQIVRFPFERMVMLNDKATMLRVNEKLWQVPTEISSKAETVSKNSVDWLKSL